MAAATSNDREVEEVFEEGEAPKQAQSIHRIRANSTIMQLSKILGESINHSTRSLSLSLSRSSPALDWGDMSETKVRQDWKHRVMRLDGTTEC